jgi:hypothetical protein
MPKDQMLRRDLLRRLIAVKNGDILQAAPADGTLEGFLEPWTPGTSSLEPEMQPGDELWIWATGDGSWESLMGRGGYAIVRNGEPVDYVMTEMS